MIKSKISSNQSLATLQMEYDKLLASKKDARIVRITPYSNDSGKTNFLVHFEYKDEDLPVKERTGEVDEQERVDLIKRGLKLGIFACTIIDVHYSEGKKMTDEQIDGICSKLAQGMKDHKNKIENA